MDGRCALKSGNSAAITPSLDGSSLPGWIYRDATETLIREIAYAHPDGRREMRAARYLNWRINRRISAEDRVLIERVQTGMGSRSYSPGPLGRNEVSLRSFAHRMRELIPESRLAHAPAAGWRSIRSGLSHG